MSRGEGGSPCFARTPLTAYTCNAILSKTTINIYYFYFLQCFSINHWSDLSTRKLVEISLRIHSLEVSYNGYRRQILEKRFCPMF